jgi:hypothetical protein
MSEHILRVALCESRHEMIDNGVVVEQAIYPQTIEDPMDFKNLHVKAMGWLRDNLDDSAEFHLFVTGMSSALAAVLRAYSQFPYAPPLVLRHFDRTTGEYAVQEWTRSQL